MELEKLPGDYIAGFVDGGGCFFINFRKEVKKNRAGSPVYFYWDIGFAILLRSDDRDVLEKIRHTLGCGIISQMKSTDAVRYAVNSIDDLAYKIVPFLNEHQLYAKKLQDFKLWEEAVEIFKRNQKLKINRIAGEKGFHKVDWSVEDTARMREIKKEMDKYKSGQKPWKWL